MSEAVNEKLITVVSPSVKTAFKLPLSNESTKVMRTEKSTFTVSCWRKITFSLVSFCCGSRGKRQRQQKENAWRLGESKSFELLMVLLVN